MVKKERTRGKINEKKDVKKMPKQISIFTVLFIVILIAAIVGICFLTNYIVTTLKYKEYTDKMVDYGYNELYDNKKATATQKVKNAEVIKVVLGSIQNNKDISSLYYLMDNKQSEIINWYNYAIYLGTNDVIPQNKLNQNATTIDVVMFTIKCIENLLDVELDETELQMDENKLQNYTEIEKTLIAKAVGLGVIPNKNVVLEDNLIIKGELNKLVITIIEKYATIHYNTITINQNGEISKQDINIVTDKAKLPTNVKEYPYVINTIEKEVYEYDYQILTERTFKNPKETYKIMGYLYGQIDDLIVRYFNKILNVDYTTISTSKFLSSIKNDVTYLLDEQDVKAYVHHVKENKIKLQGTATPLLPIIYNNGEQYVVRTKITFKVLNSDTQYNLLFGDEENTVKYNSKDITMYVDVPMGMTLNSKSLLIYVACLANYIPTQNSIVILEK